MRPTIRVSWATVVLASSRIEANTPRNSPCMRAVRSPLAIDCSRCDSWDRLPSATCIMVLRCSIMTRKSWSKRVASPRWVKSPAAAAWASAWIWVLIASRLALAASIDSCRIARLPGRRRASGERSPAAYWLRTLIASLIASRCSKITVLMPTASWPYTPGKSSGMRWLMSGPACMSTICWVCSEKRRSITVMSRVAASILPASSLLVAWMLTDRSPRATDWMACTAWPSGRVMAREMTTPITAASSDSSTMQPMIA